MSTRSYAARTKGDLKITHSDGTVDIIPKHEADVRARAVVKRPTRLERSLMTFETAYVDPFAEDTD